MNSHIVVRDEIEHIVYPCQPSPCGPNSQCREVNDQAVCSCLPTFVGSPPACRPECVSSSECPSDKACINQKCVDPCPGTCGYNAQCRVNNHSPICSCKNGFVGDPFTRCYPRKFLHPDNSSQYLLEFPPWWSSNSTRTSNTTTRRAQRPLLSITMRTERWMQKY